jgi:hypothetical protein
MNRVEIGKGAELVNNPDREEGPDREQDPGRKLIPD